MCNLESPDLSRLLPNHVHIQQQTFLKQQNKNQSNNKKGRMEGECVLNEAFYLERMLHQGCMWEVTQGHQLPSQPGLLPGHTQSTPTGATQGTQLEKSLQGPLCLASLPQCLLRLG